MQGRTAMSHALGDAVAPLNLRAVAANIFTDPEIATVGWSAPALDEAGIGYEAVMLPLATNPRAKMQNVRDGFVKLFSRSGSGRRAGRRRGGAAGVRADLPGGARGADASSPSTRWRASFTVYPSMSGSIAEAARQLHARPP